MRFLTLALTVVLAISAAQSNAAEASVRVLSLDDCIKIALEHNLDIQIEQMNPDLAEFSLRANYGSYEPALTLSGTHANRESTGGTKTETDSLGGAIGGFLPWGMNYSLGLSMSENHGTSLGTATDFSSPTLVTNTLIQTDNTPFNYFSTNYPTLTTRNPFDTSSADAGFFQVRQPLLKNFLIDGTRLSIYIAKNRLKTSELGLRDTVMSIITKVEVAYYNFIYAEENVKVQEKALQLAEQLVADQRRRVELGSLAPLDEKQAESQAAASRANLLDARAGRDSAHRELKGLLSDQYSDWIDATIQPTETLKVAPQKFDLHKSWSKGEVSRPDLIIARIELENTDQSVKLSRNQKLPSLDIVGDAGYAGTGREFSSAFTQVRRTDYPHYAYGVEMSIPLGNTVARNNYKKAKISREQQALGYKQLEQGVLILIENAVASGRTSLERTEATRQAASYAEDALKAEQKKLDNGKSTSFQVLDLQSKLTAARTAEIRALADYNIALAKIAREEGSTLERRGVTLKVK